MKELESPDSFMDTPKTNGTTTIHFPSSNESSAPPEKSSTISSEKSLPSEKSKHSSPKSNHKSARKCLGEHLLTLATLLGVALGIGLGLGLRSARTWTKREVMYVNFPGELFLNMLKCLILPLIMSSLVAAVGSLDTKLTGKIGYRAVAYYVTTTILAIILGIILVVTIKPGVGKTNVYGDAPKSKPSLPEDSLMDLIRNMFPPNIIEAAMKQAATVLIKPPDINITVNDTENSTEYNPVNSTESSTEYNRVNSTENSTVNSASDLRLWDRKSKMVDQMNILGIVVFSIVLGLTLAKMKKKGKPLLDVFVSLSDAMMIITKLVIWISPVGVMFLVASKVMEMKDLTQVIGQIGLYTATVLGGVLMHGFIVLPLIYYLLTRKNPFTFIVSMGQALATAFGTASSSATLPVTISCLEENGIDPRVARFCLPIGATINMDGTALYEAVAAIFIAQVRNVPLSFGGIVAISITSTAASIGAAGIPQAGIVTMVMVLNVVGLPADDVTLILVVDWILDRFRTLVNVLGDAFGSAIVAHHSVDDLAELEEENLNTEMTAL